MKKALLLLISIISLFADPIQAQHKKEAGAATEPVRLIRGPYLQVASSTGILVRWRTDVSARSKVRFGTVIGKLDQSAEDLTLVTEHKIKLGGLKPCTKYYYVVGGLNDTLQGNEDNFFVTLPEPGKAGHYRIAALGDCGDNSINQRHVKAELLKYLGSNELNAWILLGDNAYQDGTDS